MLGRCAAATMLVFAVAAPALADKASPDTSVANVEATQAEAPPVPLRWLPNWLMEALSRAIADATDTRDRHPDR